MTYIKRMAGGLCASWLCACGLTEILETDVCTSGTRYFSIGENNSLYVKDNLHATSPESGAQDNEYKIRLAFTSFPVLPINHVSIEILPKNRQAFPKDSLENALQFHGVIKTNLGEPAGLNPCTFSSVYNQLSGNNLLKGQASKKDLNVAMMGRAPSYYLDLAYVSPEEAHGINIAFQEWVEDFNESNLHYGVIFSPNSNTFAFKLIEFLEAQIDDLNPDISLPDGTWTPGFGPYPL